jgi:7-carboxy-7-deazaguanine synthase
MTTLPVMEHFYTIQGEGYHQGAAAYFIRLAGCEVGCVWCDVKDSWDVNAHPVFDVKTIAQFAIDAKSPIAVITGGEPAMHDLHDLTSALHRSYIRTHIETSGVYQLTGEWDWICFSPKKFKAPHPSVSQRADELKVIVYNKSDFEWGEQHAATVGPDCKLFLQPEWSKEKEMLPLIIEHVKQNPRWQISLQVHKYMNIP